MGGVTLMGGVIHAGGIASLHNDARFMSFEMAFRNSPRHVGQYGIDWVHGVENDLSAFHAALPKAEKDGGP